MKILKLGLTSQEDLYAQLEWQRGDTSDSSKPYLFNEFENDTECEEVFNKISSFYKTKKDSPSYEAKYSTFIIWKVPEEGKVGNPVMICKLEIDMAPFCD